MTPSTCMKDGGGGGGGGVIFNFDNFAAFCSSSYVKSLIFNNIRKSFHFSFRFRSLSYSRQNKYTPVFLLSILLESNVQVRSVYNSCHHIIVVFFSPFVACVVISSSNQHLVKLATQFSYLRFRILRFINYNQWLFTRNFQREFCFYFFLANFLFFYISLFLTHSTVKYFKYFFIFFNSFNAHPRLSHNLNIVDVYNPLKSFKNPIQWSVPICCTSSNISYQSDSLIPTKLCSHYWKMH